MSTSGATSDTVRTSGAGAGTDQAAAVDQADGDGSPPKVHNPTSILSRVKVGRSGVQTGRVGFQCCTACVRTRLVVVGVARWCGVGWAHATCFGAGLLLLRRVLMTAAAPRSGCTETTLLLLLWCCRAWTWAVLQGLVPVLPLPQYFASEWSFAQFRLQEGGEHCRSVVGFGAQPNTLIIVTQTGEKQRKGCGG